MTKRKAAPKVDPETERTMTLGKKLNSTMAQFRQYIAGFKDGRDYGTSEVTAAVREQADDNVISKPN